MSTRYSELLPTMRASDTITPEARQVLREELELQIRSYYQLVRHCRRQIRDAEKKLDQLDRIEQHLSLSA